MKKIHIESRNYNGKLYSIELPKGDIAEEFRTYLKKNGITYEPSEAGDYIHFSMWYENDADAQKADDYLDVIWSKYESVKKPVKEAYDENDNIIYVRVHDNWDTDTSDYLGDIEGVCVYGNDKFYFWGDEDDRRLYDNINKYLDNYSDIEDIKDYCRVNDEQAAEIHDILDKCYNQGIIEEDELFPAIMEVVHGQKYYHSTIRGATQGEWAECVYPQSYGPDYDDYIECMYFNLGAEIEISEGDPDFKDSDWSYVPISYPSAKDIRDYVAKNSYPGATIKLLKPRQVVSYEYDEYDESVKRKSVKESKSRKYTVKELRDYARTGMATDITNAVLSDDELNNLEVVGLSYGTYGRNGGLFQDRNTGEFYVITARNSNLFRLA